MAKTWDEIRAVRYSPLTPPPEWPSNVRPISIEGVSLLGIDPATNHLYWDGKEVVLRDRVVTLGGFERFLVGLALLARSGCLLWSLATR
jgi:hypothetical protein